MKKLLFILLFTFSLPFAQNCVSMSDEIKTEIKNGYWENSHDIIFVHNGVVCDKGSFWNGTEKRNSFCVANYKDKRISIYTNHKDESYYTVLYYDEFGMPINEDNKKTKMNCIDLYKQFKADMSK